MAKWKIQNGILLSSEMEYFKIDKYKRLFVVGDIHGCWIEISKVMRELIDVRNLDLDDQLVFIGDYIDRGPRSYEVIELMLFIQQEFPKTVFLRGNHEDMLIDYFHLDFCYPGNYGDSYTYGGNGGQQTILQYEEKTGNRRPPESHLNFYRSLVLGAECDRFIFTHAGMNPRKEQKDQDSEDLLWIREKWIQSQKDFGKPVVSGHTPIKEVAYDLPYKMLIDTGCIYGNKLSCVNLTTMETAATDIITINAESVEHKIDL